MPANAGLELLEGPMRWPALWEEGIVYVFGREAPDPSDDDLAFLLVPLQDGTRADTELAPDFGRHGDLPLRCDFRVSDGHVVHYHGNARASSAGTEAVATSDRAPQ
jgi:hypothetical protein